MSAPKVVVSYLSLIELNLIINALELLREHRLKTLLMQGEEDILVQGQMSDLISKLREQRMMLQ